MTTRLPILLAHALVTAAWTISPGSALAQARQRFLLIDRDLRADTVELASIDQGWVDCLRSGLVDRRPVSDLLVLMRVDESDLSRFSAGDRALELVDGQKWIGAPSPSRDPDQLGWKVDRIGVLSAPLERIRLARLLPEARLLRLEPDAAEDRLLLANGDELAGLLVNVGDEVLFEVSGSDAPTRIALPQVASIALVNARERTAGMMVWLADGSVLRVEQCRWSPTGFQFILSDGGPACSVETDMLRGISFDAQRLMPLVELTPRIRSDSPWLRVVEPPRVIDPDRPAGLSDLEMRGPIQATWALPRGATRFFATAVVPRSAADWADFDLTLLIDGSPVLQVHMDGTGRSRREIILPLRQAASLTIRLDEGARGPIQDVIILQRPMLLFD